MSQQKMTETSQRNKTSFALHKIEDSRGKRLLLVDVTQF